jgi:DNA-binding MarR family transcriptional regulator
MSDLFTKLEVAAWGGLVGAQGRLFLRIEDDLRRKSGITHAEFEVLLRLCFATKSRARIQDLAAASLLTRSGTSRVVERLVRAGYVERAGAEEDGRGAYAVLTKVGREHFLTAARQHVALVRREFLSKFSDAELEQMASFWRRIDGHEPPREQAPPKPQRSRSTTSATASRVKGRRRRE